MPIPALLAGLAPAVIDLVGRFIPDPEERAKAEKAIFDFFGQVNTAQLEVNKAEAASGSLWNGGWRPFIGWTCGTALALQYVIGPVVRWVSFVFELNIPPIPTFDAVLWELLFGMLGMAGLRTIEKHNGVAKP